MTSNILFKMRKALNAIAMQEGDLSLETKERPLMKEIGSVEYELGDKKGSIPLQLDFENKSAYTAKTVDGEIFIAISEDEFFSRHLYSIVAHEVGHIVAGHFDNPPDKCVTKNKRKQEYYFEKYSNTPDVNTERCYYRSVLFGVLRGGVMAMEYEADSYACQFIPQDLLMSIHCDKICSTNYLVKMEAASRLYNLSKLEPVSTLGKFKIRLNKL